MLIWKPHLCFTKTQCSFTIPHSLDVCTFDAALPHLAQSQQSPRKFQPLHLTHHPWLSAERAETIRFSLLGATNRDSTLHCCLAPELREHPHWFSECVLVCLCVLHTVEPRPVFGVCKGINSTYILREVCICLSVCWVFWVQTDITSTRTDNSNPSGYSDHSNGLPVHD